MSEQQLKQKIDRLFYDPQSRLYFPGNAFLHTCILINALCLIFLTVQGIDPQLVSLIFRLEMFTFAIFVLEFSAKAWSCNWRDPSTGILRSRRHYLCSFFGLIDFLCLLPYVLVFLEPAFETELKLLKLLRMLLLFKLFDSSQYSQMMQLFVQIAKTRWQQILFSGLLLFILLFFCSVIMYTLEHPVQPDVFRDVPHTMWWSVVTLTTLGYGDMVPITLWGKVFGACAAVIGIGFFALPTGILAGAFMDAIQKSEEKRSTRQDAAIGGITLRLRLPQSVSVQGGLEYVRNTARLMLEKQDWEEVHSEDTLLRYNREGRAFLLCLCIQEREGAALHIYSNSSSPQIDAVFGLLEASMAVVPTD